MDNTAPESTMNISDGWSGEDSWYLDVEYYDEVGRPAYTHRRAAFLQPSGKTVTITPTAQAGMLPRIITTRLGRAAIPSLPSARLRYSISSLKDQAGNRIVYLFDTLNEDDGLVVPDYEAVYMHPGEMLDVSNIYDSNIDITGAFLLWSGSDENVAADAPCG